MQQNRAWLAALERGGDPSLAPDDAPPNALPPIGIDGPGLLVLDDDGRRTFTRAASFHVAADGRLVDGRGRAALGFTSAKGGGITALRVPAEDMHDGRYTRYQIDERGRLWGVVKGAVGRPSAADQKVLLGRLAIAVFPAPDELRRVGDDAFASESSGIPRFVPADASHVGTLRQNPPKPEPDAVRANLLALWSLSGRAEIDIAVAASKDALERIALNIVR